MLPFCWSGGVPENCCFTKLWRFGDSAFPAFGGTSAVKQSGGEKRKHYEISFPFTNTTGRNYNGKLTDNMRNCITVKYHGRVSNDVKISYPYCGKYIRYIRNKKKRVGKRWKWNCDTGSILNNPQKAVSAYKQGLKYKVPEKNIPIFLTGRVPVFLSSSSFFLRTWLNTD